MRHNIIGTACGFGTGLWQEVLFLALREEQEGEEAFNEVGEILKNNLLVLIEYCN